ncbi:MAG: hypothetical protein A2Y02_03370 [Omnitrophica bacterium GWA2_52_12]|nr:MAG: hypothetical protein A2Y02_03370 [Omnitrophica bacterium GWA2_52_12]
MKKIILIVDDEEILIQTISKLLERCGYQTARASTGQDALSMAESEKIDLIICDMRMPGMNGVETVTEIRKLKPEMPVVFVTGYADQKIEALAQTLKPLAYIHKPFDIQELLGTLKKHFES